MQDSTIIADTITVNPNGNLTVGGQIQGGVSASAPTVTASGTISTAGIRQARVVASTTSATALVLQAGTIDGQEITVVNLATTGANSLTFAASGSSNVADGATTVVSGLRCATYRWDKGTSLWYHS